MAERKRKVIDSAAPAVQAAKKAKKSSAAKPVEVAAAKDTATVAQSESKEKSLPKPTKKTRKRAADFLDNDTEPTEPKLLSADGVNGVVEHNDEDEITITTTKRPKKKSMMAEAERTQDQELQDQFGSADESVDEEIDSAPALLTGFDSDNDDPAEDKGYDGSLVGPIPQYKKTSKKLRKAAQSKNAGPGVVYIGRIPHGFYESEMREYFSQFGVITRLRLSRNKKTGASKHFAFVEFESDEVAKIVAETMDNYLMFGHILKCKYASSDSLHADVWKGANRRYRRIPHHKLAKERSERPRTEEEISRKMSKEQNKREQKAEKMKKLGYEYDLPTLKKPELTANGHSETAEQASIEDRVEGVLVPAPNEPKDELALKVEEKTKKSKRSQKPETTLSASSTNTNDLREQKKSKSTEQTSESVDKPQPKASKAKAKQQEPKAEKKLKGILKKSKKA